MHGTSGIYALRASVHRVCLSGSCAHKTWTKGSHITRSTTAHALCTRQIKGYCCGNESECSGLQGRLRSRHRRHQTAPTLGLQAVCALGEYSTWGWGCYVGESGLGWYDVVMAHNPGRLTISCPGTC